MTEVPENSTNKVAESAHTELLNEMKPASAEKITAKINPFLLALNLLMLAGLIVLYVLHFSSSKDARLSSAIGKASSGAISVAFVNNDSILNNYELVKKMRADLQLKGDKLTAEVEAKQKAFEKDAAYFQDQVQKKAISDQSAQEIYGQLQQNQQKIYELRDRYAAELQQSEVEMNVALLDSVMNFLHRYNDKYKFDYILGFTKGGNILFANDTLDITNSVLKQLNDEYSKKHSGK